jgi:hypothetical protein
MYPGDRHPMRARALGLHRRGFVYEFPQFWLRSKLVCFPRDALERSVASIPDSLHSVVCCADCSWASRSS